MDCLFGQARPSGKDPVVRSRAFHVVAARAVRGVWPNPSKQDQAKESKSKQNCLNLLAFIFPNPDFSMGYDEIQIIISWLRLRLDASRLKRLRSHSHPLRRSWKN